MRFLLSLALTVCVVLTAFETAWAHAVLVGSAPAHGSAYESAPPRLSLRFSDAITPVALRLRDAAGKSFVLPEPPRVDGSTLEIALPTDLPPAIYVVSWRVTAADSHPASGTLVFSVATEIPPGFAPEASGRADLLWQILNIGLRFLVTASVLLAAGTVLFSLLVARPDPALRRSMTRLAALGAVAALLAIPARGALLLDAGDIDLAAAWRLGIETPHGISMILAASGLVAIVTVWVRDAAHPILAALGATLALASFALSGHVATVEPSWLTAAIVGLHVALAAFWVGALPALAATLRIAPARAAPVIRRFSRLAFGGVAALVALGMLMAVVQFPDATALEATAYGRIFLLKLVAVVALLTLACGNRLIHTPALARGDIAAAQRLGRAMRWEMAAFASVVAATSVLSLTPPPRSMQPPDDLQVHAHSQGIAATAAGSRINAVIEASPGTVGRNRIVVEIVDAQGLSVVPRALILELVPRNDAAAALRLRPAPRIPSGFEIANAALASPGRWTIRLEIELDDSTRETLSTEVTVQ